VRVLVLSTRYPPEHAGGYELHCQGNVRHLRAHGHDVRVLTSGPGSGEPGVARELWRFPAAPEPTPPEAAERAERHNAATLERHVRAFQPDVVALWRMAELSMSLVERAATRPLVAMVCDTWPVDGPERDPWARLHGARLPVDRGRWLFVSAALRDQLAAAGVRPARAGVAHAGIEHAPAATPRPAWRGELLYAGRLSPLKGVDVAIRAVEQVPGDARLTVVGGGTPDREAALRALAGPRVTFAGPREHAAMPALYATTDAVLFPSVWEEPWGLVPLEAMAAGAPVIATGTGGSAEYLRDGENCLLVPPGDADALAAAVARLAADEPLRETLVAGGRATASRFPAGACHAVVRQALEQEAAA
jgi:glycosyltransferase involved in cell wall biosynthesis